MKIYSIYCEDKYGESHLAHRTHNKTTHYSALMSMRHTKNYRVSHDIDDREICELCGLDLSEHGTTTEIDTLESCIEYDAIGDYE